MYAHNKYTYVHNGYIRAYGKKAAAEKHVLRENADEAESKGTTPRS